MKLKTLEVLEITAVVCVGGIAKTPCGKQTQYIGPHTVKALYKVPDTVCIIYIDSVSEKSFHELASEPNYRYLYLYPRSDQDYNLEKRIKEIYETRDL